MDWRIPQVSPQFDEHEFNGVAEVIRRKWLTEGPQAASLLERIKTDTGARHAVLAPNGTLGLFLALLALDLPRGSEILIPSFTFFASASAAIFAGLKPVFVDSDLSSFNLDVNQLERFITPQTRAIMPVHVYGLSASMGRILEFASKHQLHVIEDAAQAYGVDWQGDHCGTLGDIGVISFFADKTITMGEGGAVLTNNDELYERLRKLRNQGRVNSGTFIHEALGMNFRVTDLQCAVGNAQLHKLHLIIAAKRGNYARYAANLAEIPGVRWQQTPPGCGYVPFRFPLLSERREVLTSVLENAGIQTRSFFYPLHLQPSLRPYAGGSLPRSELLYKQGLCLPIHGDLSYQDIDQISDIVKRVHLTGN